MPPADRRVEFGAGRRRTLDRVAAAPGDDRAAEQARGARENLRGLFEHHRTGQRRRAAGHVEVEHAAVDAVVGRIPPHHRFIGRGHLLPVGPRLVLGELVVPDAIVIVRLVLDFTAELLHRGRPAGGGRLDEIDDGAGVGVDEFQKPPHAVAGVGRRVGQCAVEPLAGRGEPDAAGPADLAPLEQRRPVDEQALRPFEIPLVQEGLGGLGMGAGRGEAGHFLPPESRRRRTGRRTALLERRDHLATRVENLPARHMRHAGDGRRGEAVPPRREPFERGDGPGRDRLLAVERRLAPDRRIPLEDRLGDVDEIVDPRVGQTFPTGLMDGELPREPEDVPGIDRRATLDSAEQQFGRGVEFRKRHRGIGRWLPDRLPGRHEPPGHP